MNHFFEQIDGWSELDRQGVLLETILNHISKNSKIKIAEIGVYKGRCTAMWNVMLTNSNIEYDYYAIDHFKGSVEHDNKIDYYGITEKNLEPIINKINIISSDSIEESKKYEDNFFDVVYIDASHDYESVKKDINHWFPKVKQGGFICGDDYLNQWEGVIRAVDEFFENKALVVGQTQWYYQK